MDGVAALDRRVAYTSGAAGGQQGSLLHVFLTAELWRVLVRRVCWFVFFLGLSTSRSGDGRFARAVRAWAGGRYASLFVNCAGTVLV